jgi:hypothetical protein
MKTYALVLFLITASGLAYGADLAMTPQEQVSMAGMRQIYARQMGRLPTAEEERRMLETWRSPAQAVPAPKNPAAVVLAEPAANAGTSEEALATRIANLGSGKTKVRIEGARDGLLIDGAVYLDPEGQVTSYAFDTLSGDITYTIRTGNGTLYKYLKAGSSSDAVTLASASQAATGWQITTVTGKTFSGDAVVPMAKGFMVARAGSVFRYEPGMASKGTPVPEGWNLAPFQRGNVGATHYVMLERQPKAQGSGGFGALGGVFDAVKAVGAAAGLAKREDYALMNLDTGKLHLLNVQRDGKMSSQMSNCRRVNAVVNNCASVNTFESLYANGSRNLGHYYWKANWFATTSGPIAVTEENGVADIFVLDLESGKKVSAFHRALGISSFDASQGPDGNVSIEASLAMTRHQVPDAVQLLRDGAAVTETAQADTTSSSQ